ncbi:MAG: hypothetical protein OXC17_14265 [Aestuariivita sp.]|nr:hypothetical protein [Aestuariivita sp.]
MEILQIIHLSEWLDTNLTDVMPKYHQLVGVLQNNSEQSNKLPVKQPLDDLTSALTSMKTSELSALQIEVLEKIEVAQLIGKQGKIWTNNCIKTTTYDPATAFNSIQQGLQKLEETQHF